MINGWLRIIMGIRSLWWAVRRIIWSWGLRIGLMGNNMCIVWRYILWNRGIILNSLIGRFCSRMLVRIRRLVIWILGNVRIKRGSLFIGISIKLLRGGQLVVVDIYTYLHIHIYIYILLINNKYDHDDYLHIYKYIFLTYHP